LKLQIYNVFFCEPLGSVGLFQIMLENAYNEHFIAVTSYLALQRVHTLDRFCTSHTLVL